MIADKFKSYIFDIELENSIVKYLRLTVNIDND